jgi:branched-chain amino acid transport system ATP-binding protein
VKWLLVIKNITKKFGGLYAVNDCSFSVQLGTITGLIGPNGAGKTTLFDVITGFQRPDGGNVSLQDSDITGLLPYRVFQRGVCRTFQIPREFKELTVLENLMLVPARQIGERLWNSLFRMRLVRRQEQTIHEKAIEVLEFLKLSHLKDEYANTLSGGQKKLLELARTMMADPQLILLDEPGAGVNRTLLKDLADHIKSLSREQAMTFLVIEHDMDFVMGLCNPIVVMSEGRKLMEGTPTQVQQDSAVLNAYLGGQYAAVGG